MERSCRSQVLKGQPKTPFALPAQESWPMQEELALILQSLSQEYCGTCSPVWHTGRTVDQSEHLESIQKRAIKITEPDLSYQEALSVTGLEPLQARRERMSRDFFLKILSPKHKLHRLVPEPREICCGLRRANKYPLPVYRTRKTRGTLRKLWVCQRAVIFKHKLVSVLVWLGFSF